MNSRWVLLSAPHKSQPSLPLAFTIRDGDHNTHDYT